jgi:hypothetical protein
MIFNYAFHRKDIFEVEHRSTYQARGSLLSSSKRVGTVAQEKLETPSAMNLILHEMVCECNLLLN